MKTRSILTVMAVAATLSVAMMSAVWAETDVKAIKTQMAELTLKNRDLTKQLKDVKERYAQLQPTISEHNSKSAALKEQCDSAENEDILKQCAASFDALNRSAESFNPKIDAIISDDQRIKGLMKQNDTTMGNLALKLQLGGAIKDADLLVKTIQTQCPNRPTDFEVEDCVKMSVDGQKP